MPTTVEIRELKAKLSSFVGKPSLEDKLQQLSDAGVLAWSGKKLRPRRPSIKPKGGKTLSDLLIEDRG